MPTLNSVPEVLVENQEVGNWKFVSSWSPDGHWLTYTSVRGASQRDIWLLPIEGSAGGRPVPFLDSPANEVDGAFSPDGRWMAYTSDASGRNEIYVKSFADSDAQVEQVSVRGGTEPRWSRDGRELFFFEGQRLMVAGVEPGAKLNPEAPQVLFEGRYARTFGDAGANYDVSLDGKRFVMVRTKDLTMPSVIQVILNWPEALGAAGQTGS